MKKKAVLINNEKERARDRGLHGSAAWGGRGREALLGHPGQPKREAGGGRQESGASGLPEAGMLTESQRNPGSL